jgi:hypothetical protein
MLCLFLLNLVAISISFAQAALPVQSSQAAGQSRGNSKAAASPVAARWTPLETSSGMGKEEESHQPLLRG